MVAARHQMVSQLRMFVGATMTERTIQHTARELAGQFYDMVRSAESQDEKVQFRKRGRIVLQIDPKVFAKTFPTVKDYLAGRRHGHMERSPDGVIRHVDDGTMSLDTPGWMYFYDQARKMLVEMLNSPTTHENVKAGIVAALIEDREKQMKADQHHLLSPKIPQRRFLAGG